MSKETPKIFVTTIDLKLTDKILTDLKNQEFEISKPPYTAFAAKKKGLSCTLYLSGKLTVQGKALAEFMEFYLEPHVLKDFEFTYPEVDPSVSQAARIGIDESGKGDFFGPLCVAGLFAEGEGILKLKTLGVKDSKTINDKMILKIGKELRANYPHQIVKINPLKYNEIYAQFKNLNSLLAWGHATAIEQLVVRTNCRHVIVDQFADERVVLTALKRKKLDIDLLQRHRAEEDLVVAAASILAREAFLEGLAKLGREFSIELPKGASALTIATGKKFLNKYGREGLSKVCKLHFKTLDAILKE